MNYYVKNDKFRNMPDYYHTSIDTNVEVFHIYFIYNAIN